ncbi:MULTISPECIES: MarR family winged helix-turn-helix transcriptional regulator [Paenibacillus]|jgi:DNA-binding MarR family transcriptional regulator|uniref:Regulatory protein MarR n=2 Tax=Paenibacillus lactis TaxID=228574 RepID=G4HL72_9BACL|nr:MarR family transcriptional regulator [Paenibacillus lactis]EHB57526.1 regulatory protein MarR [Paenibacillus lactis 154]MBP1893981.1 DNA-binding MarR family transcriptional regulator [Paenibacillus lactis]MCM3492416.1 MarR family transcriptional regulator [Paenibacillus lactis]GIO90105.1 putative HTH-type transcriptional regulator YcgE [Paenibacillus lactis]
MKPTQQDLQQSLTEASKQLSTQTVMFHQAVAAHLGLNITDHKCMDLILSKGRVTAGQLAEWTGLTTGAITSVLNRLEKAGFIRRAKDPGDLRVVYAEPVYSQLHAIKEVFAPLNDAMLDLYSKYDQDQLETILDYILHSNQILRGLIEQLRKTTKE